MKKTLLLMSLFLSLVLYAQTRNNNEQDSNLKEVNIQEESLSQQYYTNEEESYKKCESKKSGTYIKYHSNGMLESFSIVE